jgi:hypothetical protein
MHQDDSQVLAAVDFTATQDRKVRADIEKAINSHDRVFFGRVVRGILKRLRRNVDDMENFIDRAYYWFKSKFQL